MLQHAAITERFADGSGTESECTAPATPLPRRGHDKTGRGSHDRNLCPFANESSTVSGTELFDFLPTRVCQDIEVPPHPHGIKGGVEAWVAS